MAGERRLVRLGIVLLVFGAGEGTTVASEQAEHAAGEGAARSAASERAAPTDAAAAMPAEDPATDRARSLATEQFDVGVRLLEKGRCETTPVGDRAVCMKARTAFARAFAMYPDGLGALRNLANVEQALELWASASRHYRELARRAPLDPRPARRGWAELALRELRPLETKIPHLVINPPNPSPEGVRVSVDGAVVPKEVWSVPMELDPGDHQVLAEAPGHLPFTLELSLDTAETRALTIDLQRDPAAVVPPADAVSPTPSLRAEPVKPEARRSTVTRIAPLAFAAAGVVGIGVGLGFGFATIAQKNSACGDELACDPAGFEHAKTLGDVSTIAIVAGTTVTIGGLLWYFFERPAPVSPSTSPGRATPATALGRRPGDLAISAVPVVGPGRFGLSVEGHF